MSDSPSGITAAAMGFALDVAALRQQAIASNIANAGARGYVPVEVDFATQMTQLRSAMAAPDAAAAVRAAGQRLKLESRAAEAGRTATVHLDSEMADMAQNSLVYQTLIKGLNRHFTIESMAASDGRR